MVRHNIYEVIIFYTFQGQITDQSLSEALIFASIVHGITMKTISTEHVLPMFCACSFHGNSMNDLLSYCGLVDARICASEKDLPVVSAF